MQTPKCYSPPKKKIPNFPSYANHYLFSINQKVKAKLLFKEMKLNQNSTNSLLNWFIIIIYSLKNWIQMIEAILIPTSLIQ